MAVFKNRGIMLDPARLLEKRSYYDGLLPWLKEWGYNILHFHFTDDQGCAVRLPSHPELAKDNAYSPEEMRAFIARAKKLGITVIPELESLGHTQFITKHPKYAHLGGAQGKSSCFNSLHPKKKEARAVIKDLLADIAAIFPSEIIHAGLDEVDMSAIPEFSKLSRADQWKAFAPHSNWVHEEIRKLGRRPAMWGDHLLHSPQLADATGKDVLIFDWHYDAPFSPHTIRFFLDRKFEVWGCPASMQWNQKVLPSASNQLQNLREFAAHGAILQKKGCTGMINTVWCPWRYLSGVMDLPMALGGHVFSQAAESPTFLRDFAADFYGMAKSDAQTVGELIWQMHAIAPQRSNYGRLMLGELDSIPFSREDARWFGAMEKSAITLEKALKPLLKKAKRNADRLNDYVLTARILQAFGRFGAANRKRGSVGNIDALLKACDASWCRTKDEPWQSIAIPYTGTEWLLPTLKTLPKLG